VKEGEEESGIMRYTLRDAAALLFVVVLAAALRLGQLGIVEFKVDEVTHCQLALEVLRGHLPVVGTTASVGISKPPGMTYLLAISLIVSRDPRLLTGFVALLNVGAVAGCFLVVRRYFGLSVGVLSASLFAVSPWAVVFSRKIFTADVLPPFTVLLLAALFDALVGGKNQRLVLVFVWLACLLQITFSTIALVPVVALLLLIYRSRLRWRPLLLGALCFVLIFVPYLYHDLTHDFANLKALFGVSGQPGQFSLKAVRHALRIVSGANLHSLAGTAFQEFLAGQLPLGWLDALEILLLIAGVAYLLGKTWRGWQERRGGVPPDAVGPSILLLWTLVPVLLNLRPSVALHAHYFVVLYPAPYIAIAVLVVRLWRWAVALADDLSPVRRVLARTVPVALATLIVGIVAWQVYSMLYLFRFVDTHDTPWGHGVPVKYAVYAAATIRRLADETGNPQVIIPADGDDPDYSSTPAVFQFMLGGDLSPRFVNAQQALVFPNLELDTVYCLAPDVNDTSAAAWLDRFAVALPAETIVVRGGPQSYRFYRLSAGAPERIASEIATDGEAVVFANGVTLLGHQALGEVTSGHTVRLFLWWIAPQAPEGTNYHFFNHLVDGGGRRWGQEDGPGYRTSAWRAGDLIVSWFDVKIPADAPSGPFWVRTGMYTYPDVTGVPVVDQQGQPVSDAVEWEP
jgi:4-amino-4-deoxy-L-arabinose transferase-like glycosyltransferase